MKAKLAAPHLTPERALDKLKKLTTVKLHLDKAVVRDTLHIESINRSMKKFGMDADTADVIKARLMERVDIMDRPRKENAKLIEAAVKMLPIAAWAWVKSVKGAGLINVGVILGSTGNLNNYSSVYKVWKRMGLAVMPGGQRQRKFTDPDLALLAGYSPRRRSLVWILGDCLLKQNYFDKEHEQPGVYRQVYEDRLVFELAKFGATVETYDAKLKDHQASKARAKRYMEKRFLKHLWQTWRASNVLDSSGDHVPAVAPEIKIASRTQIATA